MINKVIIIELLIMIELIEIESIQLSNQLNVIVKCDVETDEMSCPSNDQSPIINDQSIIHQTSFMIIMIIIP